jgi:phage tail-like protein
MAVDRTKQDTGGWPRPKFRFEVRWGSGVLSFQEISGLDTAAPPIEYRLRQRGNVTMKKGVFTSDVRFWDWFNQLKMNVANRSPITIRRLDDSASPAMVWTLTNALPTKVTGPDLDAEGNDVAVETLEIEHEGVTLTKA